MAKQKNKDDSSAAQFRAMEERLSGRGTDNTTLIPVVVRNLDANGKTIYQNADPKEAKYLAEKQSKYYALIGGKLHIRADDKLLKGAGVLNETAFVKPKKEGGYEVAPGKVVYIWDDVKQRRNVGTPLSDGILLLSPSKIQMIKDSKVVEKIQSGDLPADAEKYGQKDFLLRTKPNYPKTKDAMEAYQRSARRQITKLDEQKALAEWFKKNIADIADRRYRA